MSVAPPTNPAWTPLGKKIDLAREVQGQLPSGAGAIVSAYNLGTTTDGLGVLQGEDASSGIAFFRLSPGDGVTISPSSDGNALVITSSVLAGNTPGVMLQSVYDPSATGTVSKANAANTVPWGGITAVPSTFPPTLPIPESGVTNLTSDLASKVPQGRSINTLYSLEGGGALTADLNIALINDSTNPGAEMRYGTDASGVRGWYPASTGVGDMSKSVYDTNNDGIVDMAAAVVTQGVTGSMLAPGAVVAGLGYTPVNKAGDTMTGSLVILEDGPNVFPNMYQLSHLLAQVSPTGAGYPTIGLSRQASGGGAVAIWYNSGHQDLNLEYADGTSARLLSSISQIYGSQLIAASIPASALSSGSAQANLGYRPINWNGDTMVNTDVFVWQKEAGLGSTSWSIAPLRVQCQTSGARPQIGFYYPGVASSFYFEPTDYTFRHILSDGTVRVFWDDHHNNVLPAGYNLSIYGGFYLQNGASGYVQPGAYLYISGGQLNLNGYEALYANGNPQEMTIINECGIASSSFYESTLYIRSASAPGRPGIGFHQTALGYGGFLYLDSDRKLKFVLNDGTIHVITSS